jgi:hypothetical protein
MKIRRIISLTVFVSFLFLALSGLMLFLSPQGRVAYWAGWSMLGLSKEQWSSVHITFMVLFLVIGVWHIVLNWRPIVGYLKNRSKQIRVITPESSVAMGLAVLFFIGPLLRIPPFAQFLDASDEIKAYWENTQGSPPWGHAEESRLDAFCRRVVDFQRWEGEGPVIVDCEDAIEALLASGLAVEGPDQRIIDMADANETTPQAIADIIVAVARPATPEEVAAGLAGNPGRAGGRGGIGATADVSGEEPHAESVGRFAHPGSGMGRMTLREYADAQGHDLDEILAILDEAGIPADANARFRDLATAAGLDPAGIIDVLNRGG